METEVKEKPICVVVDIPAFNHNHLKLFPNVISVSFLVPIFLRINNLYPGKFEKNGVTALLKRNFFGGFMVKPKAGLVSTVYYLQSVDYIHFLHSIPSSTKLSKTPSYN